MGKFKLIMVFYQTTVEENYVFENQDKTTKDKQTHKDETTHYSMMNGH